MSYGSVPLSTLCLVTRVLVCLVLVYSIPHPGFHSPPRGVSCGRWVSNFRRGGCGGVEWRSISALKATGESSSTDRASKLFHLRLHHNTSYTRWHVFWIPPNNRWLRYLLWNWPHTIVTGPHWWQVEVLIQIMAWTLDAVRQQAINWSNACQDLWLHMMSEGHNELT